MRNTKTISVLLCTMTMAFMLYVLNITVFATSGDLGEFVPAPEDSETVVVEIETDAPVSEETNEPQFEFSEETQTESEEVYDDSDDDDYYGDYEYIEDTEEETEAPTYFELYEEELPEVESQDVTSPTIVELPEVEVSDTSLIGGVVAWLCVALGIAVIAGVLVSQRTRQSNSYNSNDRRRR